MIIRSGRITSSYASRVFFAIALCPRHNFLNICPHTLASSTINRNCTWYHTYPGYMPEHTPYTCRHQRFFSVYTTLLWPRQMRIIMKLGFHFKWKQINMKPSNSNCWKLRNNKYRGRLDMIREWSSALNCLISKTKKRPRVRPIAIII